MACTLNQESSTVYLAYHEPYSLEQHHDLIARCIAPTNGVPAIHTVLGQTLDGRDMDMLTLGKGERKLWLIGRQHPGETMASYFFEGFLERLMDPTDSASAKLLRDSTIFCVPVRMLSLHLKCMGFILITFSLPASGTLVEGAPTKLWRCATWIRT
jgi:murein tripeptide amidase MpaA